MDVAVFAAYPAARNQSRYEAHKPTVGVVVGGSGLSANLCGEVISESQATAGSFVDDGLKHFEHFIGTFGADHFVHPRLEGGDDFARVVFDAID